MVSWISRFDVNKNLPPPADIISVSVAIVVPADKVLFSIISLSILNSNSSPFGSIHVSVNVGISNLHSYTIGWLAHGNS